MNILDNLKYVVAAAAIVVSGCATVATAQEPAPDAAATPDTGYPFVPGDFWEVTGVELMPGGGLAYANHLADQWRAGQEFAKSKGWIKDYIVLSNYHARDGEPDLYLISISAEIPTGAEAMQHFVEYQAWASTSAEQLQSESGDRAEFRRLMSDSLLQEMNFKD